MPVPLTFQHVRESLSNLQNETDLDLTPDFLEALEAEGEEVTVEINGLEDQLPGLKRKLDALWDGERDFEYELVSVFMHRGEQVCCTIVQANLRAREDKRGRTLLDVPGSFA